MNILKNARPDLLAEADAFVDDLKKGKIRKRVLINNSDEYPLEKALESFVHLSSSKETEELMIDAYANKKSN